MAPRPGMPGFTASWFGFSLILCKSKTGASWRI